MNTEKTIDAINARLDDINAQIAGVINRFGLQERERQLLALAIQSIIAQNIVDDELSKLKCYAVKK